MDQLPGFPIPGFVQLEFFATCDEHVDQNRDPNAKGEATSQSDTKTSARNCYFMDSARGPLRETDKDVEHGGHEVLQVRTASQEREVQLRRPPEVEAQHGEMQREPAEFTEAPQDRELQQRRPEVEAQRREIQRQLAEMQASQDRELKLRLPEVEAQHREIQRQLEEMQASQYRDVQRQ